MSTIVICRPLNLRYICDGYVLDVLDPVYKGMLFFLVLLDLNVAVSLFLNYFFKKRWDSSKRLDRQFASECGAAFLV